MSRRPDAPPDTEAGGFLARWSRLKQDARSQEREPAPEPEPPPEADAEPAPETGAGTEAETPAEPPAPDLPPVDSLTRDSDFTPFLRKEVPAELRRQALRRLWRSDPLLANLDGLNDYEENYAAPSRVGAAVRTAYDALKGYAARDEQEPAAAAEVAAQHDPAASQHKTSEIEQPPGESPAAANTAATEPEDKKDEIGPHSPDTRPSD
ncbi:DUF3306 domain-containing protein [Caenispirillum bisanense]|uniref:DUF3306 domain-containing protein n=1 Tax=Caenispirillum bisanense TaxID=414052 RepID=UPI0031E1C085